MALATQCPHCHTTFRVAHDQLKLRAGLVRCGACKQIFNGIENLLRPEELDGATRPAVPAPPTAPAPTASSTPTAPPAPPEQEFTLPAEDVKQPAESPAEPESEPETEPKTEPESEPQQQPQAPSFEFEEEPARPLASAPVSPPAGAFDYTTGTRTDDPLLRMTLLDVAPGRTILRDEVAAERAGKAEPSPADDALEQVIDDLQNKPWREKPETPDEVEGDALDQAEASDYEEPAFVRQARRRQRIGRALRIIMGTGSILLFVGLAAQLTYVFRDEIAARFPETRPLLAEACSFLDCHVGLPQQIESVSIESSELQTLSAKDSTFALTVLLRNQGDTAQAWPHIELTLNDANEKPIARRVFTPREYLSPADDLNRGIAPDSEHPIKLFFELTQLKASGYRVYLFYP